MDNLFEYLISVLELQYISDLRQKCVIPQLQEVLEHAQPRAFSLESWNDAFLYISCRTELFDSCESARNALLEYLANT